ncbi:hypothetical protein EPN28_03755 [Patescibacteria group bacterium]|nr:MAG: hypothetical protein EPN28_03755 [Patescibacteria group bacterium]
MLKYFSLKNAIIFFTAILFLVPLVVFPNSTFPFVFGKAMWVQVGAAVILALYLILLMFHFRENRPRFSWLSFSVFLFYAAMLASAWAGVDFWRSFWSRAERMQGVFTMLHYGALFLVWRSVLNKDEWYKLWKIFTALGLPVALIAVYQIFSPRFLFNIGSARMSATLGNPIYVAGFCLFLFFSALIFACQERQDDGGHATTPKNLVWWFWLFSALASLIALFATQTRGDIIGLWAGLIFIAFALAISKIYRQKTRKIWLSSLIILLSAPLILLALVKIEGAKNWPVLGRFAQPLEFSNGGTRLLFWKTAVIGWQEKKWLGWGWENFYDLANRHYQPEFLKYDKAQEWTDNAHNILFNTLATTGILGLLAYLAIYSCVYYCLFKKICHSRASGNGALRARNPDNRDWILAIGLGAFFTAHLVQNLFVFENESSYLFFFYLLAGVDVIARRERPKQSQANERLPRRPDVTSGLLAMTRLLAILLIFFAAFILINRFSIIPAKADHISALAIRKAMTDFGSAIKLHKEAIKIKPNPYAYDISFEFGQFFLVWLAQHPDFAFSDYRKLAADMYSVGEGAMKFYLEKYPADARAGAILARAYQDGYDFWLNPGYLEAAVEQYKKILPYSPRRQTIIWGLARAKMLQGKNDEAIKLAQEAIDLAPGIAESHWMLALIYLNKNDLDKAYGSAKQALELGYGFNQKELKAIYGAFAKNNDVEVIEKLMKK